MAFGFRNAPRSCGDRTTLLNCNLPLRSFKYVSKYISLAQSVVLLYIFFRPKKLQPQSIFLNKYTTWGAYNALPPPLMTRRNYSTN